MLEGKVWTASTLLLASFLPTGNGHSAQIPGQMRSGRGFCHEVDDNPEKRFRLPG
jgi:hypothetical protein